MLFLCLLIALASCMYLPGVSQKEYSKYDPVYLKVVKLDSTQTLLPYKYYELPFCKPEEGIKDMIDNLGEVLVGDRIENSRYSISALLDVKCRMVCPPQKYDAKQMEKFRTFIAEDYRAQWLVDGLPAAYLKERLLNRKTNQEVDVFTEGYPIGKVIRSAIEEKQPISKASVKAANAHLYNHVDIILSYNDESVISKDSLSIVQFEVVPKSIQYDTENAPSNGDCPTATSQPVLIQGGGQSSSATVAWTYSVVWKKSSAKWNTRWDIFLKEEGDDQIHWFSIINSLMIVVFLTGIVAVIMLKTVSADFRKYRELETQEEAQEETGWKLVHGDVFRPPAHEMLLSVFVGNGVQVLTMTGVTLLVAVLGFLSPANRGALLTSILVLYALMGIQAGYVSARLYKMMKGTAWKRNTIQTALLVPGVVLSVFFILNLVLAYQKSSAAIGFLRLLSIGLLWIGVSVPLVFLGAYYGYKKDAIESPCKVNQIPRQVPPQVWYQGAIASILMGGVLPFGAIFIELFFIFSSLWMHQFYYLFPFLFLVFVILIVTCAEITIVMAYFQLVSEDYRWWWRSFLTSGSSALYVFLYSGVYFFSRLHITRAVSLFLYFAYTLIMSSLFFFLTGTVGFLSCFWFTRKIYGAVKVD